ncbi:MAG: hypothetical protein ACYDBJ_14050 [Aggregatilineales bacterium]
MEARLRQAKPAPQNRRIQSRKSSFVPQPETAALLRRAHQKPESLNADDVIHLQRTLGNAAVTHLLGNKAQRMATQANHPRTAQRRKSEKDAKQENKKISPSSTAAKTIQRLIGFELETRIPLAYEQGDGSYTKPDYDEIHADVGLGDGSEIGVDKDGTNPIAEFVSGPVDDTQSADNFKLIAQNWVNVIHGLRNAAEATPPMQDLHATYPTAPANARFGFTAADQVKKQKKFLKLIPYKTWYETSPARLSELDKLAIQVTHSLQLSQVGGYMSGTTYATKLGGRDTSKENALHETEAIANTLLNDVTGRYDPAPVMTDVGQRNKALADFKGLLSLMVHYLVLGSKNISGYVKNQMSLFFKSKLSDVRNNLVQKGANPYSRHLLFKAEPRQWIRQQILTRTGRDGGTVVLPKTTVTCDAWLKDVLKGTDDQIFEQAKNDWGKDIKPGKVAGKQAVVLEHRDLVKEMPPDYSEMKLSNPAGVVNYLVSVFSANKTKQGL